MLEVNSVVRFVHNSNEFVVQHKHDFYECVFYISGKAIVGVNGESVSVNAPSVTITSPNIKHDEQEITQTEVIIILFKDDSRSYKPFKQYLIDDEKFNQIKPLFTSIYEQFSNEHKATQEINSLFALILSIIKNEYEEFDSDIDRSLLVENLKKYIKSNYYKDIDFDAISSMYGYSYSRLRHIFKEDTGYSFHAYVLNLRLNIAKDLLINTKQSIKEIAISIGFNGTTQFDIFFSSRLGMSASKFREVNKIPNESGIISTKRKEQIYEG